MKRMTCSALIAALLLWAAPSHAASPKPQPDAPRQSEPSPERPWAKGVSAEDQKAALTLFKEGNALLKESVFVQAAARYREALKRWDHPAIHYNLVLALLNLDQPIEVHEHLLAAMKYGVEPLDTDKFEQAKAYKVLTEQQLAKVQISCKEPGASVAMDGRALFTAPGQWEGFVRPGPHSILASKEGFITNEIAKPLPAGETSSFELELLTAAELTQYRRRWSLWVPWAVVGAGAVVAAAGGGLHYNGIQQVNAYDQGIVDCGGCIPSADLESNRTDGARLQGIGFGGYAVGGAALVTGAVLVYMNRLQPYQVNAPSQQESLTLAPIVGPETRGVAAALRF